MACFLMTPRSAGAIRPGGQDARRHLVEQRLEQVVVGAVHHRDVDVGVGQRAHRVEAAEAAADDDDPVRARTAHAGSCATARSSSGVATPKPKNSR